MRLLNIKTLKLSEHHGSDVPPYLIASHRWFDAEPTFKDVQKQRNQECRGYDKIRGFCDFATKAAVQAAGVSHLWIDTCCIDKSSSAELTESINSMMRFYSESQCCLVYLADVDCLSKPHSQIMEEFRESEWFERAWTLQELLAPKTVLFLNSRWEIIGHKGKVKRKSMAEKLYGSAKFHDLTSEISTITGIPYEVLWNYKASAKFTADEKTKWLGERQTTRQEDLAYCLLGIFNVHMPLVYGEGTKAHDRLLREIAAQERSLQDKADARRVQKLTRKEGKLNKWLLRESYRVNLTILPPGLSNEGEDSAELRYAGIASLYFQNNLHFPRSHDLAVGVTASTLRKLGYSDPGETLHHALFHVGRQSRLVRDALRDAQILQWPQSQAIEHMLGVLRERGHGKDNAKAILAVYYHHNPAALIQLDWPYIEPLTSVGNDVEHAVASNASDERALGCKEAEEGFGHLADSALGLSIDSTFLDIDSREITRSPCLVASPSDKPGATSTLSNLGNSTACEEARAAWISRDSFSAFTQQPVFF